MLICRAYHHSCHACIPDIGFTPTVISQDTLESTFGDLRQRGGGTQIITVLSIAYK
jgi:hypothetical protein